MKKEDIIFERKEFLNMPGHHGMANIVTHITTESRWRDDELDRSINVKLDIADCSRVITMDVDGYDEYERENTLHKLDVLIDVLTDFKKALKKEYRIQDRLEKKREAKKLKQEAADKKEAALEKAKEIAKAIVKEKEKD